MRNRWLALALLGVMTSVGACQSSGAPVTAGKPSAAAGAAAGVVAVEIQLDAEVLCESCARTIRELLRGQAGVVRVHVDRATGVITAECEHGVDRAALERAVQALPQYGASARPSIAWTEG